MRLIDVLNYFHFNFQVDMSFFEFSFFYFFRPLGVLKIMGKNRHLSSLPNPQRKTGACTHFNPGDSCCTCISFTCSPIFVFFEIFFLANFRVFSLVPFCTKSGYFLRPEKIVKMSKKKIDLKFDLEVLDINTFKHKKRLFKQPHSFFRINY